MKRERDQAEQEHGAAEERDCRLAALDRHALERDLLFHAALIDEASGAMNARGAIEQFRRPGDRNRQPPALSPSGRS